MTGAVIAATVAAVLAAALILGLLLAVWPPMWAAATCTAGLLVDELRQRLRRWRIARRPVARWSR